MIQNEPHNQFLLVVKENEREVTLVIVKSLKCPYFY